MLWNLVKLEPAELVKLASAAAAVVVLVVVMAVAATTAVATAAISTSYFNNQHSFIIDPQSFPLDSTSKISQPVFAICHYQRFHN